MGRYLRLIPHNHQTLHLFRTEVTKVEKEAPPEYGKHNPKRIISAGERALFSLTFVLLIVIIIVLVEIGLRMADYGIDTRAFIIPPYLNDIYIENTNLFKKYYPDRALTRPDTLRDIMAANPCSREKSAATLRGFVVGESTAQGFPYQPNQSFSKITELALGAGGKYEKVELLNLGLSAITSYCVKDIASKLLRYQPDFLVIYAGHNEYYGTISTTTGGGFFTKNLYLKLNEFRLFQLLFNLPNILNPPAEYSTLIEEQINRQILPLSPGVDEEVAANFIENIDTIVKTYQRRDIPVIIMEPVCNLCDMPPFSGEKDADFKEFIQSYAAVIKSNNYQELDKFYQARLLQKQYDRNANVRYLDAVAKKTLTGKPDLDDFKSAKELDNLPFRSKEILLKRLRDYCHDHSSDNPNLFFIPLEEIMIQMKGETVFGNEFFVDHLHFSQAGQRLVSRILAERIADIFGFNEAEKERITAFYQDEVLIDQAIHYLPACRTSVYRIIVQVLIEKPPFNKMLIPYQRKDVDGLTEENVDPQLVKLLLESRSKNVAPPVLIAASYINQGRRIEEGKKYLDLYMWHYPGNYRPHLAQARFGRTFTKDIQGTFAAYKTAYLLSDKMKAIYDEIAGFLAEHGRGDLFAEIEKYGQPIE